MAKFVLQHQLDQSAGGPPVQALKGRLGLPRQVGSGGALGQPAQDLPRLSRANHLQDLNSVQCHQVLWRNVPRFDLLKQPLHPLADF
jgi:hypothetical protein